MAIQVRRGNESDFDASKMLPGEWAVSLDTKYVRMCFAPGVVLRMATYEGFEADKAQFQAILAECRSIQSAVQRIQAEVNSKASLVVEYSNNAKTSADKAHSEAERAKIYADNAEAVTGVQIATKDRAGLIKGGDNYIAEDGTLTLITETTSTTQPNSYAGREMVLEIGGVTEQDSTAGNQLFDASTVTVGYLINSNGNPQANSNYNLSDFIKVDELTNYCISQSNAVYFQYVWAYYDDQKAFISLDSKADTNIKAYSFNTPANTAYIRFSYSTIVSGNAVDRGNISLNRGTEALPYEPYTGGIPAPNPSYPQEIKKTVVSGIKTHGKNFFKNTATSKTANGVTFTVNSDGSVTVNGTATAKTDFYLKTGETWSHKSSRYVLSGCPSGGGSSTYGLFANNAGNYKADYGNGVDVGNIEKGKNYSVYIRINSGVTVSNLVFKPMIREASVEDATYEPYTEKAITFSQPIELYGKEDVQDILTPQNVGRKFNYKRITSSNIVSFNETGSEYGNMIRVGNGKSRGQMYSTHFISIDYSDRINKKNIQRCYVDDSGYLWLRDSLNNTLFATIDDAKSFLDNNEVYILYELATETTEALPIADQIALNSILTYDGITYVEFDSEIQPTFKAEYGTSKVGGYTLEGMLAGRNGELYGKEYNSRLSALEASVVNNI